MRVLVTGAGGYIGRFLCNRLIEEGHAVVGLGLPEHLDRLQSTGCEVLLHDLSSGKSLNLASIDAVIYLAQSSFYHEMPEKAHNLFKVNVCGLIKVAESARNAGVKRFIYASTGNVYKPSFKPLDEKSPLRKDDFYALSKLTGEQILELYNKYFKVIITRFFTVYGPGQRNMLIPKIIERVKLGQSIFLEPTEEKNSENEGLLLTPCYIDDAVSILQALMQINNKDSIIINVAGSEIISIKKIAQEVGKLLGKKPIYSEVASLRQGNLIADNSFLKSLVKINFTSSTSGLYKTLSTGMSE
ncbi:MAG: UDP-glucose 4-epimerase [Pelotomaculum sp. PtaU1.Bin065]|nr:MAG: UDP-glucose 4-epimerase [Pelotomaculum sp. PtaU1.Bin065]